MILKGNRQKHITMKKTRLFALLALLMVCAVSCNNSKSINGHEYVDLGLPSGTLWAICNVGAEKPEDFGDYFSWGETTPKVTYDMGTYKYKDGFYKELTKYCSDSNHGYNGFTDNFIVLQPSDDVATVNWGNGWIIPKKEQWQHAFPSCCWSPLG